MLQVKYQDCKNEYTVVPVRNKTETPVCQVFEPSRWLDSRNNVANLLAARAFTGRGFPVDLLAGRVAEKDGVLLFNAEMASGRGHVVEYTFSNNLKERPEWLECDSMGKPRSSMTCFHVWLHDEGRDTAYVCGSPVMAFRVMEAWWAAEGRLPDVVWLSCHHGGTWSRPFGRLVGRHVLCVGGAGLVEGLVRRGVKPDAWLNTRPDMVPDNLYMECRKLEDMANDPRNHRDTVELQVASLGRPRIRWNAVVGRGNKTLWRKMRTVQAWRALPDGIPEAVQTAERRGGTGEGENQGRRKRRLQTQVDTVHPDDDGRRGILHMRL